MSSSSKIENTFSNIRDLLPEVPLKYDNVADETILTISFKSRGKPISQMQVFDWNALKSIDILDRTVTSMVVIPFNERTRPKPILKTGFYITLCAANGKQIESSTDDNLNFLNKPLKEYATIEEVVEYYKEVCVKN